MRLRVLGPLEVSGPEDVPLPLGGRRQEMLLAVLATQVNRPIPTGRLVDLLWPDGGPRDPAAALHSQVWRLRRTLAAAGLSVERREPGYVLRATPTELDALAFETLLAEARVDTCDPATLPGLLATGLGWWQGEPYAGLHDVPALRHEAGRLAELKLSWVERAAERLLEAGDPATAVAVLRRVLTEAPLRERCRALLMSALAAEGRTADAVAQYHDYRALLAEETGLDPGPAVRAVYDRVLAGGDTPSVTATAPVTAGVTGLLTDPGRTPRPLSLLPVPEPVLPMVGREGETDQLCQLVSRGHRLVTLTGPGGVGKTRLAVELARRKWGGDAGFVDLSGTDAPEEVPDAFARALGVSLTADDPAADLADAVGERELLLVVDNVEQVLPAAPLFVSLLSRCPGLVMLLTSREPLGVPGETEYPVRPLAVPPPDAEPEEALTTAAVALFMERLPDQAALVGHDEHAVARHVGELCRQLGGLPLAIELAAALARYRSVDEVFGRLVGSLTGPESGQGATTAGPLRAALGWSCERLRASQLRALRRLGVFRGRFDVAAAEAVCGGETELEPALDRFVALGLLHTHREPSATRYSMPGIVAAYLEQVYPDPAGQAEAEAAHLRHYADACRDPRFLDTDLLARVDASYADYLQALKTGMADAEGGRPVAAAPDADADLDAATYDLAISLQLYWLWQMRSHVALPWLDRIAVRFAGSPVRLARADVLRAGFLRNLGRVEEAGRLSERAALVLEQAGDQEWAVTCYALLTGIADDRGDDPAAARWAELAVRVARAGAPRRLPDALGYLAYALGATGQPDRAAEVAREALSLLDEVESPGMRAGTRINAAMALIEAGQGVVAREVLISGLSDLRQAPEGIPNYFVNLGWAHLATGEPAEALRCFRRFLDEASHMDEWLWMVEALAGCACALHQTGQARPAALALGGAERLIERLGVRVTPWVRQQLETVYAELARRPHGHDLVRAGAQLTADTVVSLVRDRTAADGAPGAPAPPVADVRR